MRNYSWLFVVLTLFAFTCEESDNSSARSGPDVLQGTWLLFESGYSPGDKYIVEHVDAKPAQKITFNADGTATSTVFGWEQIQYYYAFKNDRGEDIVSLFTTLPDDIDSVPAQDRRDYNVYFDEDGNVKLAFRFCFEGCHVKFKRISSPVPVN